MNVAVQLNEEVIMPPLIVEDNPIFDEPPEFIPVDVPHMSISHRLRDSSPSSITTSQTESSLRKRVVLSNSRRMGSPNLNGGDRKIATKISRRSSKVSSPRKAPPKPKPESADTPPSYKTTSLQPVEKEVDHTLLLPKSQNLPLVSVDLSKRKKRDQKHTVEHAHLETSKNPDLPADTATIVKKEEGATDNDSSAPCDVSSMSSSVLQATADQDKPFKKYNHRFQPTEQSSEIKIKPTGSQHEKLNNSNELVLPDSHRNIKVNQLEMQTDPEQQVAIRPQQHQKQQKQSTKKQNQHESKSVQLDNKPIKEETPCIEQIRPAGKRSASKSAPNTAEQPPKRSKKSVCVRCTLHLFVIIICLMLLS